MKFSKPVEFGPQIDVPRLQFFNKAYALQQTK